MAVLQHSSLRSQPRILPGFTSRPTRHGEHPNFLSPYCVMSMHPPDLGKAAGGAAEADAIKAATRTKSTLICMVMALRWI